MPTITESASQAARTGPSATPVLLCQDLDYLVPGLGQSAESPWPAELGPGVSVRFVNDLCHNPGAIGGAVLEANALRLVLGLCSQVV